MRILKCFDTWGSHVNERTPVKLSNLFCGLEIKVMKQKPGQLLGPGCTTLGRCYDPDIIRSKSEFKIDLFLLLLHILLMFLLNS